MRACACVHVRVCMCVCVRIRVLNSCFALKDREAGMGSQSVPLQINSLIPDPSSSPKDTHYLQRLSFFPSYPASFSSLLLQSSSSSSITPCSSSSVSICIGLSLTPSGYLQGPLGICVGVRWICRHRDSVEIQPYFESLKDRVSPQEGALLERHWGDRLRPQAERRWKTCAASGPGVPVTKGTNISRHSLSGSKQERGTLFPVQLAEHPAAPSLFSM